MNEHLRYSIEKVVHKTNEQLYAILFKNNSLTRMEIYTILSKKSFIQNERGFLPIYLKEKSI